MKSLKATIIRRSLIVIGFGLAAAACSTQAAAFEPIHERIPVESGQKISIDVDRGKLALANSSSNELIIDGNMPASDKEGLAIERTSQELKVGIAGAPGGLSFDRPAPELNVQAPKANPLSVNGFEGDLAIHAYEGALQVRIVTGTIAASDIKGEIALVSPRGDISVQNGAGALRVLGEHGLLDLTDVHGMVGSSTIMGTIRLNTEPRIGDEFRLEADHGPIEVTLGKNSNVTLQAQSTSGDVACVVPGIRQDGRRCQGILGDGRGSMWIRTVSGSITIEMKEE